MLETKIKRARRTFGEELKERILALFEKQDFIIAPAVAEKLGVGRPTAYRYLRELAMEGKVRYQNSGGVRVWYLKRN